MKSVSYLSLGVGVLAEISFAVVPSSNPLAQVTSTVPPSGVLITSPPAPVAVPPSGTVETVETANFPFAAQEPQTTGKVVGHATVRPHDLHRRSQRTGTMRTTPASDQREAIIPMVAKTAPERPRSGYEIFLSQFGKGKE